MTPQGHPLESVCATQGYCAVFYDDSSVQRVRLDQFRFIRDSVEAARRASRCFLPEGQLEFTPLTLDVFGLYGEVHALDLLRVQQVSSWPAPAVRRMGEDQALYAAQDEGKQPWES